MKILWICGLPRQVQEEALDEKDYGAKAAWSWIMGHISPPDDVELHIACPCVKIIRRKDFDYEGVHFHLIPCLPRRLQTGFLLDPVFFRSIVRKLNPDIVHGWGTEDSFSILAQALAPNRCAVQVQGLINAYFDYLPGTRAYRYVAFRERRTLKKARAVFVESGFSKEITQPYCGLNTKIIQVDHPLRPIFLNAPPTSGNECGILFVGSLCDRKGYRDAIEAFSRISDPGWKLRVVGSGDPAETANLRSLISKAPHPENITHRSHATSDSIVELMRQSSVFLLPSRMDTGPTALKEALAMGLWPVCFDNSGPREYITRFNYGSLAKTGDVEDLTDKLETVLEEKPWLQEKRLSEVVAHVRHELCADTIWKQLLSHYGEIAARA